MHRITYTCTYYHELMHTFFKHMHNTYNYVHAPIHICVQTYVYIFFKYVIYILACKLTFTHIYIYTYIHTDIHTNIHVYIRTHAHKHTNIHSYLYTYLHTYIRTYVHTYIYRYIHTYIHAYIHLNIRNDLVTVTILHHKRNF